MLRKANINWTAKTLCNQIKNEKVNFDCAVQRGYVWDVGKKGLLIHSMIEGYPIPALYFAKNENGTYDALDGKQRCSAIRQFINGEFDIPVDIPPVHDEYGNEEDITGMTFEGLPEWCRDAILDYSLTIYYFEGITEDEVREMFFRLNNGKALTSIELTRVKAESLATFQNMAKHPAIAESITQKGKERYNDENTAMQMYVMCFSESPNFSTKAFRPAIEKANVTEEQFITIMNALDYVKGFHDYLNCGGMESKETKRVAKKAKSRSHLVSLCYMAMKAIEAGISQDDYNSMAYAFFNTTKTSIDEDYNSAVGSGSARAENVQKRMKAVEKMVESFEPDEKDEEDDEEERGAEEAETDDMTNKEYSGEDENEEEKEAEKVEADSTNDDDTENDEKGYIIPF